MQTAPRPPIEQLCRDLHGAILRVLQPSADVRPMPWQEFQRRTGLENWDRHAHWKLKEGQLRWGPDKLITVARSLGIRTSIVVTGPETDSNAPSAPEGASGPAGRYNAPTRLWFGTGDPTICAD